MSFERSIKMLILSVTFMGGALLTPILTGSADAQAAGPHLRVFDGGYVAMTSSADQEDEEIGEVTVDEEGDTQGEDAQSSDKPEYKYISIRRY